MNKMAGKAVSFPPARTLALCLLAALLLAGTALGEVSREGLVGEWHFDGDAKDTSRNGNDGTIYGASFVDGKFGKALSFDGVKLSSPANLLTGWRYSKKITIDHTKIDSDLIDFPVLVKLDSSNFDFSKARSDGYDIRFISSDGTTLLKYERERHDSTNQKAEYWVKIPSVSSTVNTDFYLYSGNSGASDGADPAQVWDSNFKGVWHLKENPSGTAPQIKDSTSNNNHGTTEGSMVSSQSVEGKTGKALDFDGSNDNVHIGTWSVTGTDITVEAWFKRDTLKEWHTIFSKFTSGDWNNAAYYFGVSMEDYLNFQTNTGVAYQTSGLGSSTVSANTWYYGAARQDSNGLKIWLNLQTNTNTPARSMPSNTVPVRIGAHRDTPFNFFDGIIDEIRVSNVPRSDAWIKASYYSGNNNLLTFSKEEVTELSIKKEVSPYSIRQYETTTVTIQIKNSFTSEIKDIQIMDSIHPSFDLIFGDFPNPKKFDIIRAGESRELQYTIKAKESGTFTLDPITVTYADKDGNIHEVKSEPVSIKVIPSSEGVSGAPSGQPSKSASVSLTGEKTDVVLGEDILLKLSAVNLITKPKMHVQVIIIPPSGMSVTSSEFSKSGTNQFTANYELEPGDGKDIGVRIKPNQIGDFNVNGRIIYYFGDEKDKAEDQTLNLPIKVRKEIGSDTAQAQTPAQKSIPGFELFTGISGLLLLTIILKRKR